MGDQFSRSRRIFGTEGMERLFSSRVIVFGLGGVGGYVSEALARSGVGSLDLVDNDTVSLTNLNRQIYALQSTVGRLKVDVAAERISDINPSCRVTRHKCFFLPETADSFDFSKYDYVVDCIDTVKGKISIIQKAFQAAVPVISSMGTGGKTDPTRLEIADISETSVCPLARVMRRELRKLGIEHLKVVYSKEEPVPLLRGNEDDDGEIIKGDRVPPGSTSFVPPAAGLILASQVVRDITGFRLKY
ncbi:MAG TPA: tRNA threonylcarbamoyladenosine dehydratase [Treponema sp.]|jgi:tRNA A37 threonylcarbamoyladenosine dehydratase|nr:tRNA threonylcarbamoyladenosine dehydratase [Treponema sp.]